MQYLVAMEVAESLGHVVANVHLNVERERGSVGSRSLQEAGQAIIHQFHEQDRQSGLGVRARAQVLDHVGVPQAAQEVYFSLEAFHDAVGGGVPGVKEDRVQDFSRADELVALGPVDSSVGSDPQRVLLRLDQLDVAEPETTTDTKLLRHFW